MKENKILDLFCGLGGFSLGFEWAGFETVFAVDFWKEAIKTYNKNRVGDIAIHEDIRNINLDMLKSLKDKHNITGIIGGPPCQGYSQVGLRDVNDPRNYLYLEYYRIVKDIRPLFFVIENVKGLLTLNNGLFAECILNDFTELGYNVTYKVLNASNYGVPQSRERVFFVGIKNKNFTFPEKRTTIITTKDALSDLPNLDKIKEHQDIYNYEASPSNDYQSFIRNNSQYIYNHNFTNHTEQTIDVISKIKDGGTIKDLPKEYWEIRRYNTTFCRMNSSLPSKTIDTGHRNYFHYEENRIPSVRECCRLQSIPDSFVIEGAKTNQYKQVGNAVPPLLSYFLALKIKETIKDT